MTDFVSGLNPNAPTYNSLVSEAAGEVRGIKQALKGSFPLFNEALDVGPEAISGYEARISALENSFVSLVPRRMESGIINVNDINTTYTVTGLGFTPTFLIVTASSLGSVDFVKVATGSYGFSDGVNTKCLTVANDFRVGNSSAYISSTLLWRLYGAQGTTAPNDLISQGEFVSFDPNGFKVRTTLVINTGHRLLWTAFE